MSLYTYIPKDNTAKSEGLLSTRLAPKGWEKYIERTGKNTKEEVLAALDSWKPGFKRSNGISVFSEPIGPDADPEMLEFANAKQLVKLPSAKALLLAKVIKRIEATNTGNRRGTHTVKDVSHKPINWSKKKPGKFLFSNVPHYLLETTNGMIPPEYLELVNKQSNDVCSKTASYNDLPTVTPKQKLLQKLVTPYYLDEGSHGWNDHIADVYNTFKKIKGKDLDDKEFAAVVMHDIERKNWDKGHNIYGAKTAAKLLAKKHIFKKPDIDEIRQAILEHSGSYRREHNIKPSSELSINLNMADRGTPQHTVAGLADRSLRYIFEGSDLRDYKKLNQPVPYDINNDRDVARHVISVLKQYFGENKQYEDAYGKLYNPLLRKRFKTVNTVKEDDIIPLVDKYRKMYQE